MSFHQGVNLLLYALSGFCFGIFAARWCVYSAAKIVDRWRSEGVGGLFGCLPFFLLLAVGFFFFPMWFVTRTELGSFVYYLVLIFFFNRGYRTLRGGR